MEIITNKVGNGCMWDGDPIYCQECKKQTSVTHNIPNGKSVCGQCAYEFDLTYVPTPCAKCGCLPVCLYVESDQAEKLCLTCYEGRYGVVDPADIFDHLTKPWGGRLAAHHFTIEKNRYKPEPETVNGWTGNVWNGYGVSPMCAPSKEIFEIRERAKKDEGK